MTRATASPRLQRLRRPVRLVVSVATVGSMTLVAPSVSTAEARGGPAPGKAASPGAVEVAPRPIPGTRFRISSFNVLGASHTDARNARRGFESSSKRIVGAVKLLNDRDVDLVGFQELQPVQFERFKELTGRQFGAYPGRRLSPAAMHNSIAWRRDTWELVEARTIPVPYFNGNLISKPYVLLRNLRSGQLVWVLNTHNPADTHGHAEKWRDRARELQIALVNELRAADPEVPVLVTGDMNEREDYFCPVVAETGLLAANGGYADATGCTPPPRMRVDWVFGTKDVTFSNYLDLDGGLVDRVTDHPMIIADAAMASPLYQDSAISRVLVVSVDGLRSRALRRLETRLPVITRLREHGASTLNARTAAESTATAANLASLLTGRRVTAASGGHGLRSARHRPGATLASLAGDYIPSVFDAVHDRGRRTLLAGSSRAVELLARSYDGRHGAADVRGRDNGAAKVDRVVTRDDDEQVVTRLGKVLQTRPASFSFVQLTSAERAGRRHGYRSQQYAKALRGVDSFVGTLVRAVKTSPRMTGRTLVVVTAASGGTSSNGVDRESRASYQVPLIAWGPGVLRGTDLYARNPWFTDPGEVQVGYRRSSQPIRNSSVVNLSLAALGLPVLPGSQIDPDQELAVLPVPGG